MFQLESPSRKIDTVMIMLLFFLFAAAAFILILVGIKQYKITADTMNNNYEMRTATSYITEKIRQHDTSLGIEVTAIDSADALALYEELDGEIYTTYIYYYDGFIRELFVGSDSVYTAENGQEIIEIGGMQIKSISSNSISITLTDTSGYSTTMYLSTKSS